jgi:hypothetical protein
MFKSRAALTFPCGADWSAMTRIDDRARLCAACDTVVTNLSAMSEADAERLVASNSGRLCVRYLYDPKSGEIAFDGSAPPLVPLDRLRASSLKKRLAKAAAVLTPLLVEACGGVGAYDVPSRHDPFTPAAPSAIDDADGGDDADAGAADAAND